MLANRNIFRRAGGASTVSVFLPVFLSPISTLVCSVPRTAIPAWCREWEPLLVRCRERCFLSISIFIAKQAILSEPCTEFGAGSGVSGIGAELESRFQFGDGSADSFSKNIGSKPWQESNPNTKSLVITGLLVDCFCLALAKGYLRGY